MNAIQFNGYSSRLEVSEQPKHLQKCHLILLDTGITGTLIYQLGEKLLCCEVFAL